MLKSIPTLELNSEEHIIISPIIPSSPIQQNNNTQMDNIPNLDDHYKQHLIHSMDIAPEERRGFLTTCHFGAQYANMVNSPPEEFIRKKMVSLPETKYTKEKVLFLDLDNTLIYRCQEGDRVEHYIQYKNEKGKERQIGIQIRPYLFKFLKQLANYYEIYIFTSAKKQVAQAIVKFLDPLKKYIKGTLYRDYCMKTNRGHFIKDLRIIRHKSLSQLVILDKKIHSFAFQIENGIPVIEWKGSQKDHELISIVDYLIELSKQEDVRVYNKEKLKLFDLGQKHLDEIEM